MNSRHAAILSKMYIHTHLHAFASLSGVFSLSSPPLNIIYSFFCLSVLCLILLLPCSSCLLHSPGARPSAFLSLPSACPLILLLPCVLWLSAAVCPLSFSPFVPVGRALDLSAGLLCVVPCVVLLVCYSSAIRRKTV